MKRKNDKTDELQMELFIADTCTEPDVSVLPEKKLPDLNANRIEQSNFMNIKQKAELQVMTEYTAESYNTGRSDNRFTVTYLDYLPNGINGQIDARALIGRALQPWCEDGNNE